MTTPVGNKLEIDLNNPPPWFQGAFEEATKRAREMQAKEQALMRYTKYQDDPVGFCADVLDAHFTKEIEELCLSVRDNPVTVARSGNATGKSFAAARIALWFFKVFPDAKVFMAAAPPLENLQRILWGEMMHTVRSHKDVFRNERIKATQVWRHDQSFIDAVAIPMTGTAEERESKFSGKHSPHMLFIVDEGDAVPDEVYKGIESCMSGGYARLLILFNPRAKSGPVFELEDKGAANVVVLSAFDHPNVVTGRDIIPGAVDREITVRRINAWTRPLSPGEEPDDSCFEVPDFLVGCQARALDGKMYAPLQGGSRKVEEQEFWYMVMARYPEQDSRRLIADEWIEAAVDRWKTYKAMHGDTPPPGIAPIISVDTAEYGTDSNCAALRYGDYVAPIIAWGGLDIDESTTKAMELYKKYGADIAMIDAMGIGAGIAPAMARRGRKDKIRAVGVRVSEKPSPVIKSELGEFYQMRDQLWWACREWLRTSMNAMIPDDYSLREELRVAEYEVKNGIIKVMKKEVFRQKIKRSPDRADALCLTFAPFERARFMSLEEE